jgi:hypothetical protein
MTDTARSSVLVVIGNPVEAARALACLEHPQVDLHEAHTEQTIVASLTEHRFRLVVVGGHVGRRPPLVLCDAARLRQPDVAVLVLAGDETDEATLAEHRARNPSGVTYLSLSDVSEPSQRGSRIRAEAWRVLGLAEDAESNARWPQRLAEAEQRAIEAGLPEAEIETVEEVVEATGPVEGAPTPEDLEFARTVAAQTRATDFRNPAPKAPPAEGVDRTVTLLRERVRELERKLARLAFVYAARQRDFDASERGVANEARRFDALTQELARAREELAAQKEQAAAQRREDESHHSALIEQCTDLQARLTAATTEATRLREENRQKEQNLGGLLKQAEAAFATVREQADRASAEQERRLRALETEVADLRHERDEILHELEEQQHARQAAEAATATDADEVATLRRGRDDALRQLDEAKQRHAKEQDELQRRLAEAQRQPPRTGSEDPALEEEIATLRGERLAAAEEIGALRKELTLRKEELARLGTQAARLEAEMAEVRGEFASREDALFARSERLKETVAQFRKTFDEQSVRLGERDKELAVMRSQLESKSADVERLMQERREATQALDRERTRSVETVLGARLLAVEELARMASDRIAAQVEMLSKLDQRSTVQERAATRLLGVVDSLEAIKPAGESPPPPPPPAPTPPPLPWKLLAAGGGALLLVGTLAGVGVTFLVAPPTAVTSTPPAAVSSLPAPPTTASAAAEGAAPVAAPAPAAVPSPAADDGAEEPAVTPAAPAGTEDRKELRRRMFEALKKKSWAQALELGTTLREQDALDWEAEYRMGEAAQRSGKDALAIELYRGFGEKYADNKFAEEARFRLAALLVKGKQPEEAVTVLEALTASPNPRTRERATKELKKLR